MNTCLLYTLSLLLSSNANDPIASSQLLHSLSIDLDFDPSKKSLLRLLPLLSPKQRDFLKSLY
jgi:hypothetical protein